MFCPNCGKDNGPSYKFCAECGSDLSPGVSLLSSPPKPAEAPLGSVPPGGTRPMEASGPGPVAPPPTSLGSGGGWGAPQPPDPFASPSSPLSPPPGTGFSSGPGGAGGWPPPTSTPPSSPPSFSTGGGSSDAWDPTAPAAYPSSTPSGSRFPLPAILAVVAVVVVLLGFGLFRMMRSGKAGASPTPASTSTTASTTSTPGVGSGTWGGTSSSSSSSSGGGATSGSVTVMDVVLCKGFSGVRGAPVDPTTTFQSTETLRCAVRLGNVHTGQRVTGAWKGPGCDTGKHLTTDRFGTWVGRYEASPSGSWQPGRYTFTLSLDGASVRTVDFEVTGASAAAPSTPAPPQTGAASGVIQEVIMCKSIGEGFKPVDPTATFGSSDTFRCVVTVNGAKAGQTIQSRWYQGGRHLTQVIFPVKRDGSGHVKFELPPKGSWASGAYRVEILVDGTLGRSAVFEVR